MNFSTTGRFCILPHSLKSMTAFAFFHTIISPFFSLRNHRFTHACSLNSRKYSLTHTLLTHTLLTHTLLTHTHYLHTHYLHTHYLHTHTLLTHTLLTHTHTAYTHTTYTHTLLTHTLLTHTSIPHTQISLTWPCTHTSVLSSLPYDPKRSALMGFSRLKVYTSDPSLNILISPDGLRGEERR